MTCALLLFTLMPHIDGNLAYYSAALPQAHALDAAACEARAERMKRAAKGRQSVAWAMVPAGQWIAWDATWTREVDQPASVRRVFFDEALVESWTVPTGTRRTACLGAREWFRRSVTKRTEAGHGRAVTICWHPAHGMGVATDPPMSPAEHAEAVDRAKNLPPIERAPS